jgi:hypothetical protein
MCRRRGGRRDPQDCCSDKLTGRLTLSAWSSHRPSWLKEFGLAVPPHSSLCPSFMSVPRRRTAKTPARVGPRFVSRAYTSFCCAGGGLWPDPEATTDGCDGGFLRCCGRQRGMRYRDPRIVPSAVAGISSPAFGPQMVCTRCWIDGRSRQAGREHQAQGEMRPIPKLRPTY